MVAILELEELFLALLKIRQSRANLFWQEIGAVHLRQHFAMIWKLRD